MASKRSACITVSTESAITSRLTSEARMPSSPMEIPSETAMVTNSIGIAAGLPDALLGPLGQAVEGQVAGRDLVPGRGHPDLGLVPVVVGHADGPEHGPGRRPLESVGDLAAAGFHVAGHGPHHRAARRWQARNESWPEEIAAPDGRAACTAPAAPVAQETGDRLEVGLAVRWPP